MKAGIVGANGYGGVELVRLLHHHPMVTLDLLVSHSTQGHKITDQYPHLHNILELPLEKLSLNEITDRVDVLFFATPSGVTKEIAPPFVKAGLPCIDLSGDFRLKEGHSYEQWYKKSPAEPEFLDQAVYGLPEIFRERIKDKTFVANPGCYPTAALLGIIPLIKEGIAETTGQIIIDGKTGVSGAGRKLVQGSLFSEINENTKAYNLGSHQHTPEIEQVLTDLHGKDIKVSFNAHLVPMTRGILCTIYAPLKERLADADLVQLYKEAYQDEYFVRIRPEKTWPGTKEVYGTNYCDIGVKVDERTNMVIVVSVIDNLVKGAAGQAIQNMNLLNHWDERTGLDTIPVYP
ncbi:N-acetyl-gamma-glutamyl-phosphate reductase [Lentibacillus populi]|uniref:N-acetyl-gamma-glutamyl-phosphate reductase n=1 Tax=Lentibacillus populi TaxID=1827502 RepID=A0A9W5TVU8_9BACI|nr:N-acetyl-gamma-glutamyl-phosphate reductase [Lentibacillus populi]GGB34461.1 N-acetyl-gamma-glutamyl-phosphate reductase [Lentibacillus populi]